MNLETRSCIIPTWCCLLDSLAVLDLLIQTDTQHISYMNLNFLLFLSIIIVAFINDFDNSESDRCFASCIYALMTGISHPSRQYLNL